MRVLLGLGGVELFQTGLREDLRHRHHHGGRERHLHFGDADLVVGQRHEREVPRDARAREAVEVLLHQRPGELSRAVGSEVEEDDRVVILHRGHKRAEGTLDELRARAAATSGAAGATLEDVFLALTREGAA